MKKRLILTVIAVMAFVGGCMAQNATPELEFVVELRVKLGQPFSVGKTVLGNRFVIPITGGSFEGPDIKGEVLSGGADYQMQNMEKGRSDIEAIYCIRTDDGVNIHIRNTGIIAGTYFFCTPKFEAPIDSKYAWLNNAIFICKPDGFMEGGIVLKVWKVKNP